MTSGIKTWVNGVPNMTPDGAGGVFIERIIMPVTANAVRKTYPALAGMEIIVFVESSGTHTWTKGVDGNGYPYVETQGYTYDAGFNFQSILLVFAR